MREPKVHLDRRQLNGTLVCGYGSPLVTQDVQKVTCKECLRIFGLRLT